MRSPATSGRTEPQAKVRRGTATVELALMLPGLLMLLFGMLELGLLARSTTALKHVANEAAGAAATGAAPSNIDARIATSAPGLRPEMIMRSYSRRTWGAFAGTWSAWRGLVPSGTSSDAAPGDQVMVELRYPHRLVVGRLLGGILGGGRDTVTLSATAVTVRKRPVPSERTGEPR